MIELMIEISEMERLWKAEADLKEATAIIYKLKESAVDLKGLLTDSGAWREEIQLNIDRANTFLKSL
jgi:hypothetical protein